MQTQHLQRVERGSFHFDAAGDLLVLQDDGDRVDDPDVRAGLAVHDDLVLEPHAAREEPLDQTISCRRSSAKSRKLTQVSFYTTDDRRRIGVASRAFQACRGACCQHHGFRMSFCLMFVLEGQC